MHNLSDPLEMVGLSISFNICNVVADVGIACCMSYLLHSRRKRIASYVTRTARQATEILMNIIVATLARRLNS
jgi:hypothetical protein